MDTMENDHQDHPPSQGKPSLVNLIDDQNVCDIIECQKNMLTRFEKTNEMLVNCNHLATVRFERASRDLKAHTQTLEELKKDLDSVFRRIRILKNKLSHAYPQAFQACAIVNPLAEDEEEEDGNVEAVKQSSQEEQVK